MSLLSELRSHPLAYRKNKRLGRGRSSGQGGTSTKGHKGQRARSGRNIPKGFEGGQMSLVRRLPKFGFTNKRFKHLFHVWNVADLNRFCRKGEKVEITPEVLLSYSKHKNVKQSEKSSDKRARNDHRRGAVKIIGSGALEGALLVRVHRMTKGARKVIESAGGTVEEIKHSKHKRSKQQQNKNHPSSPRQTASSSKEKETK